MRRLAHLARRYGFDAFVAVLGIQAMALLALRRDAADAPETALSFTLPATAAMVVPLLARRRLPFGAPATFWVLATTWSFVDGRLIPFAGGLYVLGMAAAFLLGSLRERLKARLGLAIVLAGAGIIVYNLPDHSAAEQVFVPLVFGISWLAGLALRERAAETEAAEVRAAQAERERDAAARLRWSGQASVCCSPASPTSTLSPRRATVSRPWRRPPASGPRSC